MKNTNKEILKLLLKKQLQEDYINLLKKYGSSYKIYDELISFYLHNNQFAKSGIVDVKTTIERNGIEKNKKKKILLNFNHDFDWNTRNKYKSYLEFYKNNKKLDYLKNKLEKLKRTKKEIETFLDNKNLAKEKIYKNLIVSATNYIRNFDEKVAREVIDFLYDLKDSISNDEEAAKEQVRNYISYLRYNNVEKKLVRKKIEASVKYIEDKDLSGRIIDINNKIETLKKFLEQLKKLDTKYQIIQGFDFKSFNENLENFENYFENIRKIILENYTTTKNNKINISELLNRIDNFRNFAYKIKEEYSKKLNYEKYQAIYFDTKNDIISGNVIENILKTMNNKNDIEIVVENYLKENNKKFENKLKNLTLEINEINKKIKELKKENKSLKKEVRILIENYKKNIKNFNKEMIISILDGLAEDFIKLEEDYRNYVNVNFKNLFSEKEMNEIIYKIFVNDIADYIANESEYYEKPKYQKESILKKLEADFYISQTRKLKISDFVATQEEVEKYPEDIFDLLPYIQDIDNIIEKKTSKQELLEKLKQKFSDKEINKIKNLIDLYEEVQNNQKRILEYKNIKSAVASNLEQDRYLEI